MGRALRPCLGCDAYTRDGNRCARCRQQYERERNAARGDRYGSEWAKISKAAREAHPWCARCGATTDLTTDHVAPGSLADGVRVLCRSCNSSLGATHRYR